MKAPAKIKITRDGFETYTGYLGPVHFTNAVSDDVVPYHLVNRIAAALEIAYVDDEGATSPAGAAYTLMENTMPRASEVAALDRQTEDDKTREARAAALKSENAPANEFYTKEQLEEIADGGIKPLRLIAGPWGVKGRAIPELIREILEAQANYIKDRDARRAALGLPTADEEAASAEVVEEVATGGEEVLTETTETVEETPKETDLNAAIAAAASASIADAINADAPEETATEETAPKGEGAGESEKPE